jgi:hypothetical protein
MRIGSKDYFTHVMKEVNYLRDSINEEERNNLDLKSLDVANTYKCFYGQLTGSCFSERATELIVGGKAKHSFTFINTNNFGQYEPTIVSKTPRYPIVHGSLLMNHIVETYTFLEHCGVHYPEFNEQIIKFLKKETNTLILTVTELVD